MIFQHTWEKVLSGEKTQTRRIVKDGQLMTEIYYDWPQMYVWGTPKRCIYGTYHHVLYPKTYAVQPSRGKPAVARIQITSIRREDVREISDEDVKAEGFGIDKDAFLEVWCRMHDKEILPMYTAMYRQGWLSSQPSERYQAWVLTFEVVAA